MDENNFMNPTVAKDETVVIWTFCYHSLGGALRARSLFQTSGLYSANLKRVGAIGPWS